MFILFKKHNLIWSGLQNFNYKYTFNKNYLLLILFSFLLNTALGQDYIKEVIPFQYNGESKVSNKIIRFDSKGFLWYNVLNGFVRYSGNSNQLFEYDASKNPYASQSNVSDFLITPNNKLIAATRNGILIKNLTTGEEKWRQSKASKEKLISLNSVKKDFSSNLVWLTSNTGELFSLNVVTEEIKTYKYANFPIRIEFISNGYIIIFSNDNVFALKINDQNNTIESFPLHYSLKKDVGLKVTKNGVILPKNEDGNYDYKGISYAYKTLPKYGCQIIETPKFQNIFNINTNQTNKKNPSVLVFNGASINEYSVEDLNSKKHLKLKKNGISINYILKDQSYKNPEVHTYQKSTFFATEMGIVKLTPKKVHFKKHIQQNKIQVGLRSIDQFNDTIIALTYDGFYYKSGNSKFKELKIIDQDGDDLKSKLGRNIYGFCKKNDSIIYVYGFFDLELYKVNVKTKKSELLNFKLNASNFEKYIDVADIIKHKNRLIMATTDGLYSFEENNFKYGDTIKLRDDNQLNSTVNIKNKILETLYLDSLQHHLWIGSRKNGLYKKNLIDNTVKVFTQENKRLSNNYVIDIFKDSQGNIWVGTLDGLNKIKKDGTTTFYNQSNGLQNTIITTIKESKDHIWVATYEGLASIDKKTEKINFFYEKDGLTDNEFNKKAALKTKDGILYFGTINGLVSFNPDGFLSIKEKPKIKLLSLSKYSSETKEKEKLIYGLEKVETIELPLQKNYLSLDVGVENFTKYRDIIFKYQLDDNSWYEMDKNTLTLQGLASGKHTIKISGVSLSGEETDNLEFVVKVETIFYKKTWFVITAGLFCFIISFLLYKFKKAQLNKLHEKNLIELNLKSKLSLSLMSPHFIFNILTGLQATRLIKDVKKANQSFNNYSEILRDTLDMCNKEETTILEEMDYIKKYVTLENMITDSQVKLIVDIAKDIKPDVFKIPTMMIQPIVENSIHHGLKNKKNDKEIKISFYKDDDFLVAQIVDNGQGRSKRLKTASKKSWAIEIIKNRMGISCQLGRKMSMDIIDLKNNKNQSLGTKVVLKFLYC